MKFSLLICFLLSGLALADPPPCSKPSADEPVLHTNDFHWNFSLEEMAKKFEEIQASGKRLEGRAYFDPSLKSYVFDSDDGAIRIPPEFLKSVTRHLEVSLERRYADFVFFPDMGHSHFHIPDDRWADITKPKSKKVIYEAMMNLPSMKILYHTAEQLRMREGEHANEAFLQDRILLWRYFTRNVIGDNDGGENLYPLFRFEVHPEFNSLSEIKGYTLWSGGFNVSTSRSGCFPYQKDGKTLYFDLSLEDLPLDPNDGGDTRKRVKIPPSRYR